MDYLLLPNTDLKVSRLCFGCEPIGGTDWGIVSDDDSINAVRKALELGVNFFDTADVYGLGHSEEILATALGEDRKDVVITTKVGVRWQKGSERARTVKDSSPDYIVSALEASLRRLKIECISIYQIHWPDPNTRFEETFETLRKCQQAGKVKYLGVSNFTQAQIEEIFSQYSIVTVQCEYSLLARHCEKDILPWCHNAGIGTLAYGVLAQGLLTGKYNQDSQFSTNDRRHRLSNFDSTKIGVNQNIVHRLRKIAQEKSVSPSQVAIRWAIDQPNLSCVIVGAKTSEQIADNAAAFNWRLSSEERSYIEAIETPL